MPSDDKPDFRDLTFSISVDEITCSLFYLSAQYGFDYKSLLLLYERFGRDLMYIFYMLSDEHVKFPSSEEMIKANRMGKRLRDQLVNGDSGSRGAARREVREMEHPSEVLATYHEKLRAHYNAERNVLVFNIRNESRSRRKKAGKKLPAGDE